LKSQKNFRFFSFPAKVVQMTDGLGKILVFHLPGTSGAVLDAGKTDNALPPVGGNGFAKGNSFCGTRFHALAALDACIFIGFRGEGNGFSRSDRLVPSTISIFSGPMPCEIPSAMVFVVPVGEKQMQVTV
jgi:hypothetical protein